MSTLTANELIEIVRRGLSRATLALLDGDERLAELAARNDAALGTNSTADAAQIGHLTQIGTITAELARVAQKRAPKRTVPDRLHPNLRAVAREADRLIETAASGRPVDPATMQELVDDLLARVQRDSRRLTAKEARRALQLAQLYAAIADHAVAMSHSGSAEPARQVA